MISLDPKRGLDWLGVSIRLGLRHAVEHAEPPPDLRRRLLERAVQRLRQRNWEPEAVLEDARFRAEAQSLPITGTIWSNMAYLTLMRGLAITSNLQFMLR